MAKPFDLRKQLTLHDNGLLRWLFAEHSELLDFPWNSLKPYQVEPLVEKWEAMPETNRRQVQVILQDVSELADERGDKVLAEELGWRCPDKLEAFAAWKSLLDKAIWAYLETRTAFDEAAIFARAEALRSGQFANRWNDLPKKAIEATDAMKEALQDEVRSYYWKKELRGQVCCVHHYSRANGAEFFFAYLPDWPDKRLVFDAEGNLTPREESYTFTNVFIYLPSEGAIELIAKGGKQVHLPLRRAFCKAVLTVDVEDDEPVRRTLGDFHMNDPLHRLWPLLDAPEPTVAAHIVKTWLPGVHERLLELGFLLQAEEADLVLCPECHGHFEEVIVGDGPDGTPRFFVPCPEVHRAHVPPEARCRWSVNVAILVESLAAALGLTGRCSELSPGRLWRLGRTAWQGRLRDVMFARGLHWEDARAVHRAILRRSKLIIFVAQTRPPDDFWRGRIPAILALSQVATLGEKGIEMDALEIVAAIKDTEAQAATSDATVVSVEQLKLTIRQQVKAESKTTLTDDILIAAYRQHASLREAAAFLSEQTGKDVSKDKVHRAVKRAGGVQTVRNVKDSDSIKRTVASQRRDRLRKFASPM